MSRIKQLLVQLCLQTARLCNPGLLCWCRNGVIDKQELVQLFRTTNNGLQDQTLDFLADMAIAKANHTTGAEESDHIHFKEYCVLVRVALYRKASRGPSSWW